MARPQLYFLIFIAGYLLMISTDWAKLS